MNIIINISIIINRKNVTYLGAIINSSMKTTIDVARQTRNYFFFNANFGICLHTNPTPPYGRPVKSSSAGMLDI